MKRAFFKVRLFMAAMVNAAVHGAGDVLFLTEEEAQAHGHKLEPLTADQAAALGVTEHTAANIVADVRALPADAVVKGLSSGSIHVDTARAAFPESFAPDSIADMSAKVVEQVTAPPAAAAEQPAVEASAALAADASAAPAAEAPAATEAASNETQTA